jgi:hypothetical protein
MVVREEGRVKEPVKPEQPRNAVLPMVVTEVGIIKEPLSPEQPSKAFAAILVMVGSRVISPKQQEEEGVFLLMQLRVIPWTEEEKRRRSQRGREMVALEVVRVCVLCPLSSVSWHCLTITTEISSASAAGGGARGEIKWFARTWMRAGLKQRAARVATAVGDAAWSSCPATATAEGGSIESLLKPMTEAAAAWTIFSGAGTAIDSFGESSIAGESTGSSLGTGWDGDLSSAHSTGISSVGEGEGSRGGSLGSSLSDTMIRRARGKVYQTCGKIVREKTMSETSDSSIGSGDLSVFSMFSDVLVFSLINHEEKEKKEEEERGGWVEKAEEQEDRHRKNLSLSVWGVIEDRQSTDRSSEDKDSGHYGNECNVSIMNLRQSKETHAKRRQNNDSDHKDS